MTIEGKFMRIQAWTLFFILEEETPTVPIWIMLPSLPLLFYKKPFLTPLLESVGKILCLDNASVKSSRAGIDKVKMQIDFTNPRCRHVWIGLHPEDETSGFWLLVV